VSSRDTIDIALANGAAELWVNFGEKKVYDRSRDF
jgi:hypothetical protein